MRRALALALCAAAWAAPARAACPAGRAPPSPDAPASAAATDAYMRAVARASSVVTTAVAGLSVQGRPLRYAVVSALPARRLRAGLARLHAVRAGRAHTTGDAPAVVWVAGSVHGNETSGADADLRLLHELARRCHDPLLQRVAVVVDPVQNPDGHEAGVRFNANGFDLNRDWLAVTQPETEARLRALLAMPPLAYADQHEQGGDLFFFPPYETPLFHELPDAALAAERGVIAPAIARAFDHQGYEHTSGRDFDLLYPGYGDSATTLLFGAAGMTFEVGAALPYARRVAEQLAAARALIEAVGEHRAALLRAWARSFAQADRQGARGELQHRGGSPVYGYWLGPGAEPLVARLMAEGVAVRRLDRARGVRQRPYGTSGPGGPATLPAGTYIVPSAQPVKHWVEAMLGRDAEAGGPSPSDVGAWSRPLLMGLTGGAINSPLPPAPPAAAPAVAAPRPLAGRRVALLADPGAAAPVPPGVDQPSASTSWARWALTQRLGAQVDVLDDAALAAGALAGHEALLVGDGGAATLSSAALKAIGAFVAGGGTYVGWRSRGVRVANAAGLTTATIDPTPPQLLVPGAAVRAGDTVVLDNDDPLIVGGNVVALYGAVLSGWTEGPPAGRPAIVDERVGTGRVVLYAFDPFFRASTEGAERLVTRALLATAGARRSAASRR
jgi:predicted deacylase